MKFNPATLPKNEINSGKIWTLLQFNEEFGKDVQWFSEKYKRSKNKRVKQENRDKAISELHNKFEEIKYCKNQLGYIHAYLPNLG